MVNEHVVSGTGRRLKLGPVTGRNPHQTLALGRKRQIQHEKYGNPFPQLLALTAGLFLLDLVVPDPIPLADELLLGLATLLLANLRKRR